MAAIKLNNEYSTRHGVIKNVPLESSYLLSQGSPIEQGNLIQKLHEILKKTQYNIILDSLIELGVCEKDVKELSIETLINLIFKRSPTYIDVFCKEDDEERRYDAGLHVVRFTKVLSDFRVSDNVMHIEIEFLKSFEGGGLDG